MNGHAERQRQVNCSDSGYSVSTYYFKSVFISQPAVGQCFLTFGALFDQRL